MSVIVTRSGKGSALTHTEMDANVTNLNTTKLERDGSVAATADIPLGTNKITGLGNPTASQDAATKTYVDTADATKLNLSGGTMSGAIAMGANAITGVSDPSGAQDAATKAYADTKLSNVVEDTTPQLGGSLDVNGQSIVSVSDGNIAITPNGTGAVVLDGISYPQADGSANQVIKTDGSGNLSFTNASGFTGDLAGSTLTDSTQGVTIDASSTDKLKFENTDSNPGSILMNTFAFSSGGTMFIPSAMEYRTPADKRLYKLEARGSADDGTHDAYMYLTGASNQFLVKNEANNAFTQLQLKTSKLVLHNGTSKVFDFPTADGSANQVLKTNGSGVLSFADQTAGDVVSDTSPQLGGNLDVQDNYIFTSHASGDVQIKATASTEPVVFMNNGNNSAEIRLIQDSSDSIGTKISAMDNGQINVTDLNFAARRIIFDGHLYSTVFRNTANGVMFEFQDENDSNNPLFQIGDVKVQAFKPIQHVSLTTSERDSLTAANGMIIYNSTLNKLQGYENGGWANLI